MFLMKQVLVEIDDTTARRLERVAPGHARKRSSFIRFAIRRALDEIAERETERAYREAPGTDGGELFDASVWDEWAPARPARRRPR